VTRCPPCSPERMGRVFVLPRPLYSGAGTTPPMLRRATRLAVVALGLAHVQGFLVRPGVPLRCVKARHTPPQGLLWSSISSLRGMLMGSCRQASGLGTPDWPPSGGVFCNAGFSDGEPGGGPERSCGAAHDHGGKHRFCPQVSGRRTPFIEEQRLRGGSRQASQAGIAGC
jgi:hypothetical protein